MPLINFYSGTFFKTPINFCDIERKENVNMFEIYYTEHVSCRQNRIFQKILNIDIFILTFFVYNAFLKL